MSKAKEFDIEESTAEDLFYYLKSYQKELEYSDTDIKLFERMNHKTLEDVKELIKKHKYTDETGEIIIYAEVLKTELEKLKL